MILANMLMLRLLRVKNIFHIFSSYSREVRWFTDEAAAEEIVADFAGYIVQGRDVFYKFLEMIDGRVRSMIEYDYNKSVVAIAKDAKDARRAT